MQSATLDKPPDRLPRSFWAVLLSLLLHAIVLLVLVNEGLIWTRPIEEEPLTVTVDLQPEPPKPPPEPPKPPPEPAKPPPEAPKPPEPAKPPPEPPKPPPPRPILQPVPRPPPLQLKPAPLSGKQSIAPLPSEAPGSNVPLGPALTQTEQDFILGQILNYWHIDPHAPDAKGLVLQAMIIIRPDGLLESPMNKNDPWNPAAVISGYEQMRGPAYAYQRMAIEAFLLAIRMAQPLSLPPGGGWPRPMVLRFAFDDL